MKKKHQTETNAFDYTAFTEFMLNIPVMVGIYTPLLLNKTSQFSVLRTLSLCPTCLLFEVEKEFLVEDEGHSADLFYFGLCTGVPVDEVGRDGNCKFTPELLPFETWKNKDIDIEGMWIFPSNTVPSDLLLKPQEI